MILKIIPIAFGESSTNGREVRCRVVYWTCSGGPMSQEELLARSGITRAPLKAAGRPTCVRYLVLAAGCSMALLAYAHRLGFTVVAPEIKQEFGLSGQDMGWIMSVFLIAYGLFQVPAGFLGDRLGA